MRVNIADLTESGLSQKKTSSTGITDSQLTDDSHFDSIYYPDLDSEMDSELETKADTTDLLPTEQMTK